MSLVLPKIIAHLLKKEWRSKKPLCRTDPLSIRLRRIWGFYMAQFSSDLQHSRVHTARMCASLQRAKWIGAPPAPASADDWRSITAAGRSRPIIQLLSRVSSAVSSQGRLFEKRHLAPTPPSFLRWKGRLTSSEEMNFGSILQTR